MENIKIVHYNTCDDIIQEIQICDELNELANKSFGTTNDPSLFKMWIIDNCDDMFVAYHSDKIIGCAFMNDEIVTNHENGELILTYVKIKKAVMHEKCERILINPTISCLCRDSDPMYKGVGHFILDTITTFYKQLNGDHIYLVSRSDRSKPQIYDHQIHDSDYKLSEYYLTNQSLLKYYQDHGFEIVNGLYYSQPDHNDPDYWKHCNVLKKTLDK